MKRISDLKKAFNHDVYKNIIIIKSEISNTKLILVDKILNGTKSEQRKLMSHLENLRQLMAFYQDVEKHHKQLNLFYD